MQRFFVPAEAITSDNVTFTIAQARQMASVLRMQAGGTVLALDNQGACYRVELTVVTSTRAEGRITGRTVADEEPRVHITLCQGLVKADKWELVLQKGTELGVSAFVPMQCQRSVVRLSASAWERRRPRWEQILQEAAEQAGRGRIPALSALSTAREAFRAPAPLRLALHPSAEGRPLRAALTAAGAIEAVRLFVGPEGGFSREELAEAVGQGIEMVTLGPRVLRTETAGLAAAAAISYGLGEWG